MKSVSMQLSFVHITLYNGIPSGFLILKYLNFFFKVLLKLLSTLWKIPCHANKI